MGRYLEDASINGVDNQVYTGEAITLQPVVSMNIDGVDTVLRPNNDYTVVYENNINTGRAVATFTGMGEYMGTVRRTFAIKPYDIGMDENSKVTGLESVIQVPYQKNGAIPEVVVSFGEKVMKEGSDYTLIAANNKKVCAPTVTNAPSFTITGTGNFTGSITKNFTITQASLTDGSIKASDVKYKTSKLIFRFFTGIKRVTTDLSKVTPLLYDADGRRLKAGTDYSKNYTYTYVKETTVKNGNNAGVVRKMGDTVDPNDIAPAGTEIRVTVTGAGNYKGIITSDYRVVESYVSAAKVSTVTKSYTGKAQTLTAGDLTVKMGRKILTMGTDFEIVEGSYVNNVNAGKTTVTIRGIGTYGGTKKITFRIKKAVKAKQEVKK